MGSVGRAELAHAPQPGQVTRTSSGDGNVWLWNLAFLTDPLARLCASIGGSFTRKDWALSVPSGPTYRDLCAET